MAYRGLRKKHLYHCQTYFLEKKLKKWMNDNTQIVAKLSKVNVWNKNNQQMEKMYNGREELVNIFSYVDIKKLFNVRINFLEFNRSFVK